MKENKDTNKNYIKAKNKVRDLMVFYIHLIGYIIVLILLLWNLSILEEGNKYKEFFTLFNSIIMLAWTIFIVMHGWNVFKGKLFFKKSWEDRKMNEYIEKEEVKEDEKETTIWE